MTEETRYQRIAREQAERQAAREKRMKAASKPRRKRSRSYGPSYMHDTGPGFFSDPDGLDRDNLGASPDY